MQGKEGETGSRSQGKTVCRDGCLQGHYWQVDPPGFYPDERPVLFGTLVSHSSLMQGLTEGLLPRPTAVLRLLGQNSPQRDVQLMGYYEMKPEDLTTITITLTGQAALESMSQNGGRLQRGQTKTGAKVVTIHSERGWGTVATLSGLKVMLVSLPLVLESPAPGCVGQLDL